MWAILMRDVAVRVMGRYVLVGLDAEVQEGECVLLTGPNGVGKTTLLRLLATAVRPSRGTLGLLGHEGPDAARARGAIALMTHQHHFYEPLTGAENLQLVGRLTGRTDPARQRRLLEWVGLGAHGGRAVRGYSAGMKRRLVLARTALIEPRLVLLDEPFGQLDPAGVTLMEAAIAELRGRGATLVLATHDIERGRALTGPHWHLAGTPAGFARTEASAMGARDGAS